MTLTKTDIATLERFHRTTLKQLQSLPPRTANAVTYLLLGVEPLEALVDKAIAALVGKIARQPDSILHTVLSRQLAVKNFRSHSWVTYAQQRLLKYDIPTLPELVACPVGAPRWKALVRQAVATYWDTQLKEECASRSTLRFFNWEVCSVRTVHRIWQSNRDGPRYVTRAVMKAKLLTGVYILQATRHRFNQFEVDGTCLLCHSGVEDRLHFLRTCSAFTDHRTTAD